MEVAGVATQHHAGEGELRVPELGRQRGCEQQRGLVERPETVVPEAVAFRMGGEQREEELQLGLQVLREEGGVLGGVGGVEVAVCRRDEGRKEGALEDLAAVVPDCVEFGVQLEELGGEAEGGGGEVVCGSLLPAPGGRLAPPPPHRIAGHCTQDHWRGRDPFLDTAVQLVVFRDLLELARTEMLIAGLGGVLAAGDAVLSAESAGEETRRGGEGGYILHWP